MHANEITFNCSNYKRLWMVRPNCCYNCVNRDGYPQNLGGDKSCDNFRDVDNPNKQLSV
jgi:hypothetical protein